jgi:hypothetical protein
MAKGLKAVKAARQKGITGLAWASLVMAALGATLAAGTWMGDVVRFVLGMFPWPWIPPVLVVVALVAVARDLFMDGVPNKLAIAAVLLLPSISSATTGDIGAWIEKYTGELLVWIDESVGLAKLVGTSSSTGLAVACVAAALLLSQRTVKAPKSAAVA